MTNSSNGDSYTAPNSGENSLQKAKSWFDDGKNQLGSANHKDACNCFRQAEGILVMCTESEAKELLTEVTATIEQNKCP